MKTLKTDVLVIGAGIAGSTYAYAAAQKGLKVTLLAEKEPSESNSNLAQGGIILPEKSDYASLEKDVSRAGNGLANTAVVREVALKGEKILKDLYIKTLNTPFDRDANGRLKKTLEGAHSKARIIYSKDTTGEAMLSSIHTALKKEKNITFMPFHTAMELTTLSHSSCNQLDRYYPLTCCGAYVLNNKSGEVFAIAAKKTVLATGGVGQIFRHTTNSASAYGHGIAMAYRAGARVINMEFVQFHPTVFARGRNFLISEAVRGEGGVLINSKGKPFMKKYDPLGDLAPRDVVARAIEEERHKTNSESAFITLDKLSPAHIRERFPNIYKNCLAQGIDITQEPIPVVPAAHYFCGGLFTNVSGRTNIEHLNAIGECACTGFHGANRLASTSLLEAVAMGNACAEQDYKDIKTQKFHLPALKPWFSPATEQDDNILQQDLVTLKHTMWNYVGLVRSPSHLSRAEKILRHLKNEIDVFYKDCKLTPEIINLRNGVQTGLLIVYAALQNQSSIGCHFLAK